MKFLLIILLTTQAQKAPDPANRCQVIEWGKTVVLQCSDGRYTLTQEQYGEFVGKLVRLQGAQAEHPSVLADDLNRGEQVSSNIRCNETTPARHRGRCIEGQ